MALNKKCISILNDLLKADNYISVNELASKYKSTDRAIRYNLQKIEQFLVKNGFNYLERQHLKGVKLNKNLNIEKFVKDFIGKETPYKYVYSKEERFNYIIIRLLEQDSPLNLRYFEKKLCISRNTLIKDLDYIEKYLELCNLILIRKPRVGIYVKGDQNCKIRLYKKILENTISTKDLFSYLNFNRTSSKLSNIEIETLFSNLDIEFINDLIIRAEDELKREFDDESYGNLITHIAMMIKRIQLNKQIYLPKMDIESVINSKEFIVAQNMIEKIENKYKIYVPDEEISYIALRFLGAKVLKYDKENNKEFKNLYKVATCMTEEIERIYNVNFGESKSKIIEGLILHLRPTIYRIKFKLSLANPLYDEIIKNYTSLFLNTKKVIKYLEEYMLDKVNDQEISYIALHFGAALENIKPKKTNLVKVILVCSTGLGTAKLLETQIRKQFNVNIVDTVSSREILNINKKNYDYIISTIDIPNLDKNEYIKVNSILLKKDYKVLKKYFQVNYIKENSTEVQIKKVNELINIVKKYCDVKDIQQLQCEFMKVLLKEDFRIERRRTYMLNDLITQEFIKLNVECENWKQAIKEGTDILEEQGCIKSSYYDEIIKNFEEVGTYMVVAPGIVLSHARPEKGVKKLSMSLITLKEPINFGSETNDPVKLIVTLAAIDNEIHLKALAQLMELFMNKEDLDKILNSKNKEEVLEVINCYSN